MYLRKRNEGPSNFVAGLLPPALLLASIYGAIWLSYKLESNQQIKLPHVSIPQLLGLAAGAGLASLAIFKYRRDFGRRQQMRDYLEVFASPQVEQGYDCSTGMCHIPTRVPAASIQATKKLDSLAYLERVYWDDTKKCYTTNDRKPLSLIPLKTMPLNFHWSWGGNNLGAGLQLHITQEGIKLGADAYFLSEMVSGHGNPMYALTYFKFTKSAFAPAEPLTDTLRDSSLSSDTSSTPTS